MSDTAERAAPGGAGQAPRWHVRVGLALVAPRRALALADAPAAAGRAGNDLMRVLVVVVVAAHLRRLVAAVWLAAAVDLGVGARGLLAALAQAWTTPLVLLGVLAALAFVAAGTTRSFGRAMDAAAVAVVPAAAVELLGTLALRHGAGALPAATSTALTVVAWGWAATVAALAVPGLRRAAIDRAVASRPGGLAGALLVAVALASAATDATWVVQNRDLLRPMRDGDVAPVVALPVVRDDGTLGAATPLVTPGRAAVIEFWATWCGPCKQSLPVLERLRRELGDAPVDFVTVNLDDAAAARRYFTAQGYGLALRRDDDVVATQFGVTTIPHVVIVDVTGRVAEVHRGGLSGGALRTAVTAALAP